MAHKKGQGSSKNGRDSNPQYRGVKKYCGQTVHTGGIVVRQCGTKWQPGFMIGRGKDDTLFAKCPGTVVWNGRKVHILPADDETPRPFYLTEIVERKAGKATAAA
jgi:large subunit ribosomal protein L27